MRAATPRRPRPTAPCAHPAAPSPSVTPVASMAVTIVVRADVDAEALELGASPSPTARAGTRIQHPRQRPRPARRAPRVDRSTRKSSFSVWRAISASAPASSTPVGPPPTTTKVSHAWRTAGSDVALGGLVGEQHAAAHLERVLDALQARRDARILVVSEVRVGRAPVATIRKSYDIVPSASVTAAPVDVDCGRFGRAARDVPLAAQHAADRLGDVDGLSAAVATW